MINKITNKEIEFYLNFQMKFFLNNENIPGVEELKVDVNKNKPGAKLIINREKAGELGITTNMVGRQLRASLFGAKAGKKQIEGRST